MTREVERRLSTASQSIIVDKLLAELPYVVSPRPPGDNRGATHAPAAPSVGLRVAPRAALRRPVVQVGRARQRDDATGGSWARVTLGIALAAAMVFWPYQMCGGGLVGYMAGAAVVTLAGIWGAAVSWTQRAALAHVLAIAVMMWGLALAGDQLLRRTGYAQPQIGWTCR